MKYATMSASLAAIMLAFTACKRPPPTDAPTTRTSLSPDMPAPDMIVLNADIYTVDDTVPRAQALAVTDGRFSAIGTNGDISALAAENTVIRDVAGNTVVPGFIDGHAHVSGTAPVVAGVDLSYIEDKADWLRLIGEADARLPEGEWMRGGYWDHTLSDGLYPTKEMLDAIVPDRPILLSHIDGHYSWANSRALEMAGVTADTPVPPGGEILIDETMGEPTGMLLEGAQNLVRSIIPEMSTERRRDGLAKMQTYANQFGITGIHQMGSLQDYLYIIETGDPTLRVWYGTGLEIETGPQAPSPQSALDEQEEAARRVAATGRSDTHGPLLQVGFVKLINDGVLSAHTAVLTEEYADKTGWKGEYITSPEDLAERVTLLNAAGLPVAIHSIGDEAVRASLAAFEAAAEHRLSVPNRVEHVELLHTDDIAKFKALGVVASMQPNHATNSIAYVPLRVGEARENRAYTWQSLVSADVPLVFGSDYPTSPLNPLTQIADAMFRVSPFGQNNGEPWHPEEAVSFEQALKSYTQAGASITDWKDEIGSITVGKWADFVILTGSVPEPMDTTFRNLAIQSTYLAGREVYAQDKE